MNFLPLPDIDGFQAVNWQIDHNVLAEEGLSRTAQRVALDGDRWRTTLQWPMTQNFDAELVTAWLARCSKADSWMYVSPPHNVMRGSFTAPELVSKPTFRDDSASAWTASGATLSINARRLKVKNSGAAIGTATQTLTVTADVPHTLVIDLHKGNVSAWRVRLLDGSNAEEHVSYYDRAGRIAIAHIPSSTTLKIELGCNTAVSNDHVYFGPVSGARSLLVKDSLAVGTRMAVKGGPASTDGALKAGQFVTVRLWNGWQMVRLTEDFDTDASGEGTLVFEPALRAEPWGGGPVVVQKPFARMFVPQGGAGHDVTAPNFYGFAVEAVEDPTAYYDEVPQDTDIIWQWHAATLGGAPSIGSGTPTNTSDGDDNYYLDSDGLLKKIAAANDRIFEFDPVTKALRGQRSQGVRTNLALHSEDLTQSAWVKTDSTITADQAVAPDGTTTMDLVTEGSAGTASVQQNYTGTADTDQVFFKFLKRGNHDWVQLGIFQQSSSNAVRGWFNLRTGLKGGVSNEGTGQNAQNFMFYVGGGVYLCIIMGRVMNATTALRGLVHSAQADVSALRVNNATRYEWGAQIENNVPFWSSYIKTTTASVTRSADNDSLALLNIPESNANVAGTLVVEAISAPTQAAGFERAVSLGDGTASETIGLARSSGVARIFVFDGGVNQFVATGIGTWPDDSRGCLALGWAVNDGVAAFNGGAVVTDNAMTLPTVTTLYKGSDAGVGSFWGRYVRRVTYLKVKKPERQIRSLSA